MRSLKTHQQSVFDGQFQMREWKIICQRFAESLCTPPKKLGKTYLVITETRRCVNLDFENKNRYNYDSNTLNPKWRYNKTAATWYLRLRIRYSLESHVTLILITTTSEAFYKLSSTARQRNCCFWKHFLLHRNVALISNFAFDFANRRNLNINMNMKFKNSLGRCRLVNRFRLGLVCKCAVKIRQFNNLSWP